MAQPMRQHRGINNAKLRAMTPGIESGKTWFILRDWIKPRCKGWHEPQVAKPH